MVNGEPLTRTSDKRRCQTHSALGFTFVEALATLVLIAIVLPVAMRCITLALFLGGDAARRTEATLLAQSKISELLATGAWQESLLEGDFSQTPSGESIANTDGENPIAYTWAATLEDWLDPTVKEMTVRVIWNSRGVEREVALTTLVFTEEEQ